MPQFQVMSDCRGLDLPDGRSLRADRRGKVLVDDATAALIRGSAASRRYDALIELAPGRYHASPSDVTCDCGFTPWRWQRTCPRCGSTITRYED